jgi:hypothetical protein
VRLPIPKAVERRLRPLIRRGEEFLRDWEWTWTSAFVAAIVISFAAITLLAVAPSWWLIFFDSTWGRETRLKLTIRDIVAVGWITVWTGAFIVIPYKIQTTRKRLRGERQAERYAGGYR